MTTKEREERYVERMKELVKEGEYSVPQLLAIAYDLYQERLIGEGALNELYVIVDPGDRYNEVGDYWWGMDFDNPLIPEERGARIEACCEAMLENLQSPGDGVVLDEECGPSITHNGEHVVSIGFCPWCGRHIRWKNKEE